MCSEVQQSESWSVVAWKTDERLLRGEERRARERTSGTYHRTNNGKKLIIVLPTF